MDIVTGSISGLQYTSIAVIYSFIRRSTQMYEEPKKKSELSVPMILMGVFRKSLYMYFSILEALKEKDL